MFTFLNLIREVFHETYDVCAIGDKMIIKKYIVDQRKCKRTLVCLAMNE